MSVAPISVKVCGMTRPQDVRHALRLGADYFGVIGYPASPRFLEPSLWTEILSVIPEGKRVWVSVAPSPSDMETALSRGFDVVQAHFDPGQGWDPLTTCKPFSRKTIWLAPKMKVADEFCPEWLSVSERIVVDGYSPSQYGGTGKRVAPALFQSLVKNFPKGRFVLAGGLSGENIQHALEETGATFVDVNSGVEESPGCKSHLKMDEFFHAIRVGLDKAGKST